MPLTPKQLNNYYNTENTLKIYSALLTQNSTNAPTATILENTLGPITWTRLTTGQYQGTTTTTLPELKTTFEAPQAVGNAGTTILIRTSPTTIALQTAIGGTFLDDLLSTTFIRISIYP